MGPLGTAMKVRVLHAKLYAYALPGSAARQLFISSTLLDSLTARQLLDSSTDLDSYSTPRRMESASTSLDRLDRNSTGTRQARQARPRQRLDSASTEPRQLDTARQPGATFLTRPSNDKLGVSKKGLSPLDLPPGLIRTVLSSREPPRAQISIK